MHRCSFLLAAGVIVALAILPHARAASPAPRPNVLFIAVDDLRVNLGCYGDPAAITPNLDRLAARGTAFTRAYCQQAVCNPSRQSLLSGRRPDSIRVWDLNQHFRQTAPDVVPLPEHFKLNGYFTQAFGKIYHGTANMNDPPSWSVPEQFDAVPKRDDYRLSENRAPIAGQKATAVEFVDAPDDAYPDAQVAAAAVNTLRIALAAVSLSIVGGLALFFGSWFTVAASLGGHRGITFVLVMLLVGGVLVYDRWHKGVSWAPAVMGLCRALLPLIGFFAVGGLIDGPHFRGGNLVALLAHPCVLWLLTFSITLVARHEAGPGTPPRWAEWLLYLVPVPLVLVQFLPEVNGYQAAIIGEPKAAIIGCLLFWLWIFFSNRRHALPAGVGRRVADRLAAFPLVDFAAAGLFYYYVGYMRAATEGSVEVGWAVFASRLVWIMPFSCFGLTLLLRRWIPTT